MEDEEEQSRHGLAAQQEAARNYQPPLLGPFVGEKTASTAIADEYARAESVYVGKTSALPRTYSQYRPIKGDGNCGWRAIGFSYFEKLLEGNDRSRIQGEVTRLLDFNHSLVTIGGYSFVEEMAEEMVNLLRQLADLINDASAACAVLQQRWNDPEVERELIFYLRLLAATYLKANAATYDPFVPDGQSVEAYCNQSIQVLNREIEHLGIVALVNILLKPVKLALEIAYLDRSPGSQVNHHRFLDESNHQRLEHPISVIYLLYRPDHYDILYRASNDVQPAPTTVEGPIILPVAQLTHNARITANSLSENFCEVDYSILAQVPGFSAASHMESAPLSPVTANETSTGGFCAFEDNPWLDPPMEEPQTSSQQPVQSQRAKMKAYPDSSNRISPAETLSGEPRPTVVGALTVDLHRGSTVTPVTGSTSAEGYPIRFSPVQLEYDECTFQVKTNAFLNSIWNRAHYGNPNFHPEEWRPEDVESYERSSGKKKVKKSKAAR